MSETERQDAILHAINYWMPDSWPEGGHRYTIVGVTLTGDAESGGVDLEISRDVTESATIQFTNDECYGETPLTPADAKQRVYDGSYA